MGNLALSDEISLAKLLTSEVAPGNTSWAMGVPPLVIATATWCQRTVQRPVEVVQL